MFNKPQSDIYINKEENIIQINMDEITKKMKRTLCTNIHHIKIIRYDYDITNDTNDTFDGFRNYCRKLIILCIIIFYHKTLIDKSALENTIFEYTKFEDLLLNKDIYPEIISLLKQIFNPDTSNVDIVIINNANIIISIYKELILYFNRYFLANLFKSIDEDCLRTLIEEVKDYISENKNLTFQFVYDLIEIYKEIYDELTSRHHTFYRILFEDKNNNFIGSVEITKPRTGYQNYLHMIRPIKNIF